MPRHASRAAVSESLTYGMSSDSPPKGSVEQVIPPHWSQTLVRKALSVAVSSVACTLARQPAAELESENVQQYLLSPKHFIESKRSWALPVLQIPAYVVHMQVRCVSDARASPTTKLVQVFAKFVARATQSATTAPASLTSIELPALAEAPEPTLAPALAVVPALAAEPAVAPAAPEVLPLPPPAVAPLLLPDVPAAEGPPLPLERVPLAPLEPPLPPPPLQPTTKITLHIRYLQIVMPAH